VTFPIYFNRNKLKYCVSYNNRSEGHPLHVTAQILDENLAIQLGVTTEGDIFTLVR
jgi:hypothetical protein